MLHDKMDPNTETGRCIRRNSHVIDAYDVRWNQTIEAADAAVRAAEVPAQRFDEAISAMSDELHKLTETTMQRSAVDIDEYIEWLPGHSRDSALDAYDADIQNQRDAILAQYKKALRGEHPDQRSDLRSEWTAALLEDYTNTLRADERLDDQCGLQGPDPGSQLAQAIQSTGARLRALHQALIRRINAL
jgi:hypothetical protein